MVHLKTMTTRQNEHGDSQSEKTEHSDQTTKIFFFFFLQLNSFLLGFFFVWKEYYKSPKNEIYLPNEIIFASQSLLLGYPKNILPNFMNTLIWFSLEELFVWISHEKPPLPPFVPTPSIKVAAVCGDKLCVYFCRKWLKKKTTRMFVAKFFEVCGTERVRMLNVSPWLDVKTKSCGKGCDGKVPLNMPKHPTEHTEV